MRLSTRDLFAMIAFVAVLSWCATQLGYSSPLFWIALALSLGLAAIFVQPLATEDGPPRGRLVALCLCTLLSLCIGSLATLLTAGFLVMAELISRVFAPPSIQTRYRIAMICVAGAFVSVLLLENAELARLEGLRQKFPVVSLDDRLKYETTLASINAPPVLNETVVKRLSKDEERFERRGNRYWGLERIHDRRFEQFVRGNGFGVTRMARPRVQSLERDPLHDISFGGSSVDTTHESDSEWRIQRPDASLRPTASLHDVSRFDFLDNEGFGGIIAPRTQVAGFIEHGFHRHPHDHAVGLRRGTINRIELVSLLKFDEPRVYVLDHLPRMDQLSGDTAPTRELNEFEASALEKLRADEDLVVQSGGAEYQMLGSLRAAKPCLDCHNVQRGELLGAFSYRLTLAEGDVKPEGELASKEVASNETLDSSLRSE